MVLDLDTIYYANIRFTEMSKEHNAFNRLLTIDICLIDFTSKIKLISID